MLLFVLQQDQLDCARRMRGGGASSSRGGGSPGSLARALEVVEERLREALADGLAWVSFRLISSSLIELTCVYFSYWFFNYFAVRGARGRPGRRAGQACC